MPPASLSAFDSTDPGVVMALSNLQPVTRTVLTVLHIDPGLARQVERDRLRTLVKLIVAKPGNDVIGMALNTLHGMWRRGFPVPAFDNDTGPLLDVVNARRMVTTLRTELGTCWADVAWERGQIIRILRLLGYDKSDLRRDTAQ